MKVSLLVVISITLVMIGQAHSGKKQCMGDDGNKYDIGQSYKDLVVCVKYTCKKRGKKMKMVPKPIPNCVPEANLAANVTALEAQLENLETKLAKMMSGLASKCDTATCTSIQNSIQTSAHQVGESAAYYNYLDEMATSVCVGMSVSHGRQGHMTAIRRDCGAKKDSCTEVCQNAPIKNPGTNVQGITKWICFDSLHIYKSHPRLSDNSKGYTDSGKVGPVIYRYNNCNRRDCGPNYCCCIAG